MIFKVNHYYKHKYSKDVYIKVMKVVPPNVLDVRWYNVSGRVYHDIDTIRISPAHVDKWKEITPC